MKSIKQFINLCKAALAWLCEDVRRSKRVDRNSDNRSEYYNGIVIGNLRSLGLSTEDALEVADMLDHQIKTDDNIDF